MEGAYFFFFAVFFVAFFFVAAFFFTAKMFSPPFSLHLVREGSH
jgi:hypothetical protein